MKRVAIATFIACAAALSLSAQSPAATIRGQIVADDTGEPLANARVTAPSVALGSPVALSDDDGKFTLSVGADAQRIVASKSGYGRREVARAAGASVVDIRLVRGAAISGHVLDEFGEPVQF